MTTQRLHTIAGWALFAVAFIVYALTAQRTVMFWDSGEFIASTVKLQATHPPGAPLYTMMSRLFVALFPTSSIAYASSLFSALCGAGTVLFLYHAIVWVVERIGERSGGASRLAALGSGAVGALALTFSDSFWVSSTEAEVYTLSTLFMAAAFWCVTRWERTCERPGSVRWLVFVAFLLGLSIGVHILNLAILFPLCMIVVTRLKAFNLKWSAIAMAAALVLFVGLNSGLVQGFLKFAIAVEIKSVNDWGWSQHSGAFFAIALFAAALIGGLVLAKRMRKPVLHTALVAVAAFSIGWSSYAMAVIRTAQETPTSNNSRDVVRLLDYLRSDQFGFSDRPLIKGAFYNAPLDTRVPYKDGPAVWVFDAQAGEYVETNTGKDRIPNYHRDFQTVFPRMHNHEPINVMGYQRWVDIEGKDVRFGTGDQAQIIKKPTLGENLAFFFNYQLGWLNYRYFMWNFAGRQNDVKGLGDARYANWESGIAPLDEGRIGASEDRAPHIAGNQSKANFFMLPLLLGLIGLAFLLIRGRPEAMITGLFFLAFGVAITIFINQLPIHILIRERDYIFLGAYYAFCLWIGMGVYGLIEWLPNSLNVRTKTGLVVGACTLAVPLLMAGQGWTMHSRASDHEADIMARNMLQQCDSNAVLITSGDNVTFPLWYMQEVEELRTDVRVLDYNLMGLEWYIERIAQPVNASAPLKLGLPQAFYRHGNVTGFALRKDPKINAHTELGEVLAFVLNTPSNRYLPTDLFQMTVDASAPHIRKLDVARHDAVIAQAVRWQLNKPMYSMQDLVLMDVLVQNNFERPVYFANTAAGQFNMGLEAHFLNRGLVNQFLPIEPKPGKGWSKLVDREALHQLVMDDLSFDGYRKTGQFVNSMNADFAQNVYRPMFHQLAFAYGEQGRMEECKAVLDRAQAMMPNANVAFGKTMFEMAKAYFHAGYKQEWRDLSRQVLDNTKAELHWLTSFKPNHPLVTYHEAGQLGERIATMMTDIGNLDPEYVNELAPEMGKLRDQYDRWALHHSVLSKYHNVAGQ